MKVSKCICIAGKNDIAINVIKYCLDKYSNEYKIKAILVQNDEGIDGWQKSLKLFCVNNRIDIITLDEAYDIEELFFFSCEFDRIVIPSKFKSDNLFNIHFSLLPKYKGMYTSVLPVLNGDRETGVTLHKIDSGIDTGDIIAQRKLFISDSDNSLNVYIRLIKYGSELIVDNIDNILMNEYSLYEQPQMGSTYYSKNAINYCDLSLDVNCTAYQIVNQIRAFSFRPYQMLKYDDCPIVSAIALEDKSTLKAGTLISEDDTSIIIASIDYNVKLYKDCFQELITAINAEDINFIKGKICVPGILNEIEKDGTNLYQCALKKGNIGIIKLIEGKLGNGS